MTSGRSPALARRLLLGTAVLCVLATLLLSYRSLVPQPQHLSDSRTLPLPHSGEELVVVFIGASDCGASRDERLPAALNRMRVIFEARASRLGMTFRTIGVSLDVSPDTGLAFLHHLGTFDEIIIGGGWLSSGAIQYVWRDVPGRAALPQVILLQRHIGVSGADISVNQEQVLNRVVGIASMEEWGRGGFQQ